MSTSVSTMPVVRAAVCRACLPPGATAFVPYTFIEKHFSTHTATLRANFYKCGELTVREQYYLAVFTHQNTHPKKKFFNMLWSV